MLRSSGLSTSSFREQDREIRKLVTQPAKLGEYTLAEESTPRWNLLFLLYCKTSSMMLALEIYVRLPGQIHVLLVNAYHTFLLGMSHITLFPKINVAAICINVL